MHMKIYIFDDDVIISGANLNADYFNHRQDRYMLFRRVPAVANYLSEFISVVSSSSHQLDPSAPGDVALRTTTISECSNKIKAFLSRTTSPIPKSADTLLFPYFQIGKLDIREEEKVLSSLMDVVHTQSETHQCHITLSSPYLNLINKLEDRLKSTKADLTLLAASPEANGFFTAKGSAKYIPAAYSARSIRLLKIFQQANKLVNYTEYAKKGWTFHGKGIWVSINNAFGITAVGSSNFGQRSHRRDLEAQMLLVTNNQALQGKLNKEVKGLMDHAKPTTLGDILQPSRKPPYFVRMLARLIRIMGNASRKAAKNLASNSSRTAGKPVAEGDEVAARLLKRQMEASGKLNAHKEHEQLISNFNRLTWSVREKELAGFRKDNEMLDVLKARGDRETSPLYASKMEMMDFESILNERKLSSNHKYSVNKDASLDLKAVFLHINTPELIRSAENKERGIWVDDLEIRAKGELR
ncbi:Tubulin polyglutamylase complex subunit 1 [Phlyctochytrium planicorne]|nr:Tubulin polyglutamylase complex subunit 1 [Phlyctochytrium planicorne]